MSIGKGFLLTMRGGCAHTGPMLPEHNKARIESVNSQSGPIHNQRR